VDVSFFSQNKKNTLEFFKYKTFGKLNPLYFIPPRPTERLITEKEVPLKHKTIEVSYYQLLDSKLILVGTITFNG